MGRDRLAAVAAYCEGAGLGAILLAASPAGVAVQVPEKPLETAGTRLWCRRAADLVDIAFGEFGPVEWLELTEARARESVERAAASLGSIVLTDDQLFAKVSAISTEIERQIAAGQSAGAMSSFNKSYRQHRLKCEAEGIAPGRYRDWLAKYQTDLVRAVASTLKYA